MAGGGSGLASAIFLLVAGCGDGADETICMSQAPHVPTIIKTQADADQSMRECILTWAQRLSVGNASTHDVARATVRACDGPISAKAQLDWDALLKSMPADYKPDQSPSEYERDVRTLAGEEALFRSVQFRAGHCEKPRARNPITGDLER